MTIMNFRGTKECGYVDHMFKCFYIQGILRKNFTKLLCSVRDYTYKEYVMNTKNKTLNSLTT